jgi:CheY-like chemotaxis protein
MIDKKRKILIVDDTPEDLDVLYGLLQNEYQLFAAPAGVIALQIAKNQIPDLILLDIMMPEMDGYEVCKNKKGDVYDFMLFFESFNLLPASFISSKN